MKLVDCSFTYCFEIIIFIFSVECTVTMSNEGEKPVEWLDICIESMLESSVQSRLIWWDQDEVQSKLPLLPGAAVSFPLHLYGSSNFLSIPPTTVFIQGTIFYYFFLRIL